LLAKLAPFITGLTILAALPATPSYKLNSYGFGSGGTASSSTPNYSLEGVTGEVSGQTATTPTYKLKPGFVQTQQANVPKIASFDNHSSTYYDKLHFLIDEQGNPSDAKYALQISTTSDFSSGNKYVKSDLTIGASLVLADYKTYSAWGSSGGSNIIGLANNTTYYLRAKATQGPLTESDYGPSANASTVGQSLSFCLYTGANCAAGGNSVAFGNLPTTTVSDSPSNIKVDFTTNGNFGGKIYIYSTNGGLKSVSAGNYTISSATADLSSASQGFGGRVTAASESSGGPLAAVSPYDGASNNVGILGTTIKELLSSANPLVGGSGSLVIKVKPGVTTPPATDYSDILTLIAAATF
jgi:hypothetical protein